MKINQITIVLNPSVRDLKAILMKRNKRGLMRKEMTHLYHIKTNHLSRKMGYRVIEENLLKKILNCYLETAKI